MTTYALKWSDPGGNGSVAAGDAAGDVVRNVYELDLAAAPLKGVTLALNDVVDAGILPANHTVSDIIIDSDDVDTGAGAITFDVGLMTGTPGDTVNARTIGNEFFAATNVGQAGGVVRMSKNAGFRIAAVGYDRSIGVKITAAASTQATSGKIRLLVNMIPAV